MDNAKDFILDLYICELPDADMSGALIPPERDIEVRAVRSGKVRREKYFVWRLLEYAIKRSFGMDINDARLVRSEGGKWISPYLELSLSHSRGALAVAVSTHPVGTDIEGIVHPRAHKFALRVLTTREYGIYSSLSEERKRIFLTECWTQKESAFKRSGGDAFIPIDYSAARDESLTDSIEIGGEKYIFSVCSQIIDKLNVIRDVKL